MVKYEQRKLLYYENNNKIKNGADYERQMERKKSGPTEDLEQLTA